jgi:hypothetical protein
MIAVSFAALFLVALLTGLRGADERDPIADGVMVSSFYLGCVTVMGLRRCRAGDRPGWLGMALAALGYLGAATVAFDLGAASRPRPGAGRDFFGPLAVFMAGLGLACLVGVRAGRWMADRRRGS